MRDNNIDAIREAAILATIFMEGGNTVVNDRHDKGGTTKYGISQAAYPELKIEAITLRDAIASGDEQTMKEMMITSTRRRAYFDKD